MQDDNNEDKTRSSAAAAPADWWTSSLTRREAGKRALAGALTLGGVGILATESAGCCQEELGPVEENDALEVQQAQGWAFGGRSQKLNLSGARALDSTGAEGWKKYLEPTALQKATTPVASGWRPVSRSALIQALAQPTLAGQMKPVQTPDMKEVAVRGKALVSLVSSTKDPESTLLILDMPGPSSVALAAEMAEDIEPVFMLDNWPHPEGVVPSQQTLGALLFHAAELEQKRLKRQGRKLPVALALDSRRLNAYKDSSGAFDNRYVVDLPDATTLKRLGIMRILYVTVKPVENESDDLNDALVTLKEARMPVMKLAMTAFQKDPEVSDEFGATTNGYYYGGQYSSHPHFFTHYPIFLFFPIPRYRWSSTPKAPPKLKAPKWRPAPRETVFSNRTTGARSGVGRRKPTGFGRVSTRADGAGKPVRVNSQGKRVQDLQRGSGATRQRRPTRSRGRSGSFGRSRGGRFG